MLFPASHPRWGEVPKIKPLLTRATILNIQTLVCVYTCPCGVCVHTHVLVVCVCERSGRQSWELFIRLCPLQSLTGLESIR